MTVTAGAGASIAERAWAGADSAAERCELGLVSYCVNLRARSARNAQPPVNLAEPAQLLELCRQWGAGGMQVSLGVLDADAAAELRRQLDSSGMFVEGSVRLPRGAADIDRFDAELATAARVGATAVRTTLFAGRRYEQFDSMEEFRAAELQALRSLELGVPVVVRHGVPLAIENHKDHTTAERIEVLKRIGSPLIGACIDVGNNLALLEDPLETARQLAPWAHAVHLKDQAVQPTDNGFLLGDIPLGEGCIDLRAVVDLVRRERPGMRFCLELITRDPLNVPCLTDAYWATLDAMPARQLAKTMRLVRDRAAKQLQQVSHLALAEQVALEEQNVRSSLAYFQQHLRSSAEPI